MKIKFTNQTGINLSGYEPIPANKGIPEWYKSLTSYINNEKIPNRETSMTSATIKRCMPVFDALTAGYIIPTYVEVYVRQENGFPYYQWPSLHPIDFHAVEQAPNYPGGNEVPYPKWLNHWGISTPKGYSTLFIPPMHHDKGIFQILPGIVDTDTYNGPVNFPFILTDKNFEGYIPAGTPMVQVIPFKRDSWEMEWGSTKDVSKSNWDVERIRKSFFDNYKNIYRQNKSYK